MSANLPSLYVQQFASNIQLLLQQKESKLRGKCLSGSHVGKQASPVDQVGAVAMQPVNGRFQPIGRVDAAVDRRWVFPSDFDLNQLVDSFDKLRLLSDPQSHYVQNAHQAANRQIDDIIIAGHSAVNKTGETASTSTSFTAGNIVASNFGASAAGGLSVAKLKEAKRILRVNQVDFEADEIICVIDSAGHDKLMAESQIINMDYSDRPALVEDQIVRFLGMNFVYCERLLTNQNSTTGTFYPIYAKSGMYLGMWQDVMTDVDRRKDLQGLPWQAYIYLTAGATRLEEKKIMAAVGV